MNSLDIKHFDPSESRILIVDDTAHNIQVLMTILQQEGYLINVAQNGKKALEIVEKVKPDLILLDIMMPEMDGYETIKSLKGKPSTMGIPVIFLTAKVEVDDVVQGFELGAADYVTKPFNSAILLARVRTHLELRHKTLELERLAHLDSTTELANRRFFDEFLDEAWIDSMHAGHEVGLILFDVDGLTEYNEHYGLAKGDEAINRLSEVLLSVADGEKILAARYMGKQFSLVLKQSSPAEVERLAQSCLKEAQALSLKQKEPEQGVLTLSAGCVSMVADKDIPLVEIMNMAEERLSRAREGGGNRCVISD